MRYEGAIKSGLLTLTRSKNLNIIVNMRINEEELGSAHISNSLSTSSGATNPWTKISGGLCCSINDARMPRSVAGPGMKYVSLATP